MIKFAIGALIALFLMVTPALADRAVIVMAFMSQEAAEALPAAQEKYGTEVANQLYTQLALAGEVVQFRVPYEAECEVVKVFRIDAHTVFKVLKFKTGISQTEMFATAKVAETES